MSVKVKLCWYYHENSDSIFVDEKDRDFGHEHEFVHEIGDYITGTIEEVRSLLKDSHLFLLDTKDLEKLINDDIEQF